MPIPGQSKINVGAENSAANSDSLFTAFNKIQNNFTILFSAASNYTNFVGVNGITTTSTASNGTVAITNTGVTNLLAGTGVTLSAANGNVTVSVSGYANGQLVAGVTNVGISSTTLAVTNSPIVSSGVMGIELSTIPGLAPGQYIAPTVTIDTYGRITTIANTSTVGTVTSVAVSNGTGIQVTGGPITSSGTITITNTGVTRINQGPGIILTDNTGELTISALQSGGTVSQVTISSNALVINNPTITTAGRISIDLPLNLSIVGNITNSGNIVTSGNITTNSDISAIGNINVVGNLVASSPSKLKISGGTSGYFLQTNGAGGLSWVAAPGAVGTTTAAAGSNTQVQFNDVGNIGANASLTFDKTTGNLTATRFVGNGIGLTNIVSANAANYAANVTVASQPLITSVGNLVNLSVVGNITSNGNISITGTMFANTPANSVSNNIVATTLFVKNIANSYAPIASPTFTGVPITTEPGLGNIANVIFPSSQIATVNFVQAWTANKASLASPSFIGIPTAPTAAANASIITYGPQIATLGYVDSRINSTLTNTALVGIPTANTPNANITLPFSNTSAQLINVDFFNKSLYRYTAVARLSASVPVTSNNLVDTNMQRFINTALFESPPGSIWNATANVIQPTVPGYYRIRCQLQVSLTGPTGINGLTKLSLFKNNLSTLIAQESVIPSLSSMNQVIVIDDIVPFNGTTDFADMRWASNGCAALTNCTMLNGSSYTWTDVQFIRPLS